MKNTPAPHPPESTGIPKGPSSASRARLLLVGLLLILGGGYLFFQAAQVPVLACSRTAGAAACSLKNTLLGLLPLQQTELMALQSAFVGETCDRRGCTYRVELAHAGGNTPFTSAYTPDRAPKDALVRQIECFLQDPGAPPLALWQTSGIMEIALPLFLIAAGCLLLILLPRPPRAGAAKPVGKSPAHNMD